MLTTGKKKLVGMGALASNVATSVLMVFVNKMLMDASGYAFSFATTLSGIHFLVCTASIWAAQSTGLATSAYLPWQECLRFGLVGAASIASSNISLLVNKVGLYQVAKIMTIPFVCTIEWLCMGCSLSISALICVVAIVLGVATITVNDVDVPTPGMLMATVSIAMSGLQQIMCGRLQKKFNLSSHELLANTAPVQGILLILTGPTFDKLITGKRVQDFDFSTEATATLVLSCIIATAVNLTQYMCLGQGTALTYQVQSQSKTILIILGGWILIHETISYKQFWGILLAICGMIGYGAARAVRVDSTRGLDFQLNPSSSDSPRKDCMENFKGQLDNTVVTTIRKRDRRDFNH